MHQTLLRPWKQNDAIMRCVSLIEHPSQQADRHLEVKRPLKKITVTFTESHEGNHAGTESEPTELLRDLPGNGVAERSPLKKLACKPSREE